MADTDLDQISATNLLGLDDVLQHPHHHVRIHPVPAGGQVEPVDHALQGLLLHDHLELVHDVGPGRIGTREGGTRRPGQRVHLENRVVDLHHRGALILLRQNVGDHRRRHEDEEEGEQNDAVAVL